MTENNAASINPADAAAEPFARPVAAQMPAGFVPEEFLREVVRGLRYHRWPDLHSYCYEDAPYTLVAARHGVAILKRKGYKRFVVARLSSASWASLPPVGSTVAPKLACAASRFDQGAFWSLSTIRAGSGKVALGRGADITAPENYAARVDYAACAIGHQRDGSRLRNTCLEGRDAECVRVGLARRVVSRPNTDLARALQEYLARDEWAASIKKLVGVPTRKLPEAAEAERSGRLDDFVAQLFAEDEMRLLEKLLRRRGEKLAERAPARSRSL